MNALIHRVGHYVEVDRSVFEALEKLPGRTEKYSPGDMLVREGEVLDTLFFIQSGWAMRFDLLDDGRRQILNFMLPGDSFDLMSLTHAKSDHYVGAATPVTILRIAAADFLQALRETPRLSTAFWWLNIQEESILREHIVSVGRRTAQERIAHMILELTARHNAANGTQDDHLPLPIPQSLFADALGLSIVHVSRSFSALKNREMIETSGKGVTILRRDALMELADFDPDYLRLNRKRLVV